MDIKQATGSLAEYARDVNAEPIILTEGGRPIAALVPVTNADLETVTLSMHPEFVALIERSRARQQAEGGLTSAEVRQRLRPSAARPDK